MLSTVSPSPPKPVSEVWRPHLTRLPELTKRRLRWRKLWQLVSRLLIRWLTVAEVNGLENFPEQGPALIVTNHLGDADVPLGLAFLPVAPDGLAKAELYDYPVLGKLLDAYGVIWVHRGRPDRRALRAALQGLAQGRFIALAPEGRQSVTGALEEGAGGAAYLAWKAQVPVLPITFVGTEDKNVYGSLKRFRKPKISLTIGKMFHLDPYPNRREAVRQGTHKIMRALARQLPPAYRGVYLFDV